MKHSANMLAYYTASNLEMNLTVAASNLEMHSTVAASISTAGRLATPSTGDTNMILQAQTEQHEHEDKKKQIEQQLLITFYNGLFAILHNTKF